MRTPLLSTLALVAWVCPIAINAQTEYPYGFVRTSDYPDWVREMYVEHPDPSRVKALYESYYRSEPFIKDGHTQYYKRWMRSIARALPPKPSTGRHSAQRTPAQWQCIGPWDWDHSAADRSYAPGAAHVYTVEQSRSNPDVLYAGTATAGMWRSMDRGHSWTSVTDHLRTGSVTSLCINHLRHETVYAELLNSIYKSSNGGVAWYPTGNSAFQALSLRVNDLVMHPADTSVLFAATNVALYRTLNGGNTWNSLVTGEFLEVEFHPTRADTIYTVRRQGDKTEFFRSVNGGATFALQSSGWPNPNTAQGEHQRRTEIAVSPAAPDNVYALATGMANGGSGLYGLYVSTNAGATWQFKCCGPQPAGPPSLSNPNLMGWSDDGTDDGGQYYYDLALDVSPTNADSIFVAGVNLWVSGNGGASFVCPAKWSHPHKPNYVHADIHDVRYYAATHEIWVACDGGIFVSTDNGTSFHRRMAGISGTDFWGFGAGYWDGEVMLGGTYHNGTLLKDHNVYHNDWISTDGGDNFRGFVNPGKPRQVYSDYNIKTLSGNRQINNSTRSFDRKPNASYIVGESSDLLFHPHYFGTWYSGSGTQLWKTTDDGFTFTSVHNFGANVAAMEIALSDPSVIYVCTWPDWWGVKRIYRTMDAGVSWSEITPPSSILNGNTWVPYDITVDARDPMKVWIVRTSMYGNTNLNGYAVYFSENGGTTWQNITTATLNNEAFTCIMHQAGTTGGVYLGTRESVYYRNAEMSDWVWYGHGLPQATFSTRLIPYYREGMLRNGTNRSVWESPLYESSLPVAMPSILRVHHTCAADTVYFTDRSVLQEVGASWHWTFAGGMPATSTARNPKVVYRESGLYSVTLIVQDQNGSDTSTVHRMVEVRNWCEPEGVPGNALKCTVFPDYAIVPDLGITSNSLTITAWIKPEGIQSDYAGVVMSDGAACGLNFREGNNTLGYHWGNAWQAWSWDSNLEVPPDTWSHVAMVVTPTAVRLYLNGKEAVHQFASAPVSISTLKIGSYQGWQGRNFKGLIDEVCIWERSLSLHEVRGLRHLTKVPDDDLSLIAYYQFNEGWSDAFDKAQDHHAVLNGNAHRVRSRAPVGAGTSQMLTISTPGSFVFNQAGLMLSFGAGSVVPGGSVYASKLRVLPDTLMAQTVPAGTGYWILNNYGTNQQISNPDTVRFWDVGFISHAMQGALPTTMGLRLENAELAHWREVSEGSGLSESGESGSITFAPVDSDFRQLGQLFTARDSMAFGRALVTVAIDTFPGLTRRGSGSLALGMYSSDRGLLLPRYTSDALMQIPSPAAGSMAFLTDSKQIVFFNDSMWVAVVSEYLDPPEFVGLPGVSGVSIGVGNVTGALMGMGATQGLLVLPSFDGTHVTEVDFPADGLLIYRADQRILSYYDGVDWMAVKVSTDHFPANENIPLQNVPGVLVGTGSKDPNAILQVRDTQRSIGIPVARCSDITAPQQGLLLFDPDTRTLCLFDGMGWRMVK